MLLLILLLLFLPLNLLQQLLIPTPLLLLKDIVNAKGKANAKAAYQVEVWEGRETRLKKTLKYVSSRFRKHRI